MATQCTPLGLASPSESENLLGHGRPCYHVYGDGDADDGYAKGIEGHPPKSHVTKGGAELHAKQNTFASKILQ